MINGPDHPSTLTSRNTLALAYQEPARVDEAIPLYGVSVRKLSPAANERVVGDQ